MAGFKGAAVIDTKGKEFATKLVAPVAAGSESVAEKTTGGSAPKTEKQKRMARPFVAQLGLTHKRP